MGIFVFLNLFLDIIFAVLMKTAQSLETMSIFLKH